MLWIGAGSAGLAAIGIVPRIYYNSLTNLAGGNYEGDLAYAADNGGWQAGQTVFRHFDQDTYYMGGLVIALATMALVLARFRKTSLFFTLVMVGGFLFSSARETPLHQVLYAVLPRFEEFHGHWPERLALVSFIGIAMLAGIAVDSLPAWQEVGRRSLLIASIPVVIAIGFTVGLQPAGDALPPVLLIGVGIVAAGNDPYRMDAISFGHPDCAGWTGCTCDSGSTCREQCDVGQRPVRGISQRGC